MAKIVSKPAVILELSFTINESEARALDALVGYDSDDFIKVFKAHLGSAYLRGNEDGLKEFFKSIRAIVSPALEKIDTIRKGF